MRVNDAIGTILELRGLPDYYLHRHGLSKSYVSRLLHQGLTPSWDRAVEIAGILGVSLDELLALQTKGIVPRSIVPDHGTPEREEFERKAKEKGLLL
jgi:transcriptional regulator with XRE-family HTH domain